ncbi:MAG: MMPL family transporter [Desulfobacteraceae bacterium]|jgi:predicted RND superfamily exporter protein|nr:MMPL family transporter [Desulfobacteraceae bacterium]
MAKRYPLLKNFYDKLILRYPRLVILCILVAIAFLGYKARDFQLDASAETLLLETDKDLQYSRIIKARYGGYDYLVMTYAPDHDLFSDKGLADLTRLRDELLQLKSVSSVVSILDIPLIESPPVPVKELATHIQTLLSPTVDRELAREELKNSPLYQNLLISPDLKTTALQINFWTDRIYEHLISRRDHFLAEQIAGPLMPSEIAKLKQINTELQKGRDGRKKARHLDITKVRAIMESHRKDARLFLGGVSMIADDLISFIKKDLKIFGIGVLFFLVVTLGLIFKNKRWVILPILCCAFSAISMMGLLGMFGWQVTVISSNFISLQLIITMAITIHLIVRYQDLARLKPDAEHRELVFETIRLMLTPCLFTALTTMAGFGSLLLCDILPVRTFGWMMIAGIVVSLLVTFLLFPAGLMVVRKKPTNIRKKSSHSLTSLLAGFTANHGRLILVLSGAMFIISAIGISRLAVENSFIDYFKKSTEIYQGMKVIDQNLGGTTPLDVIVEIDVTKTPAAGGEATADANADKEFDEFDEFEKKEKGEKYWFSADRMTLVKKIHDYLESVPEIGKVLSLGTVLKLAEKLNNGKPLDNFQLALLYGELPDRFKELLLKPYVSVKHNQLRFSVRVRDSEKSLQRNALLKKIRNDLTDKVGLKKENVQLTGLLVLYNNMLQSLFDSQILTLGVVVLALMAMFLILFRSLKLALIAIVPNLLAIGAVLGFMGWAHIPLDMMTITIAAISIGIAVDNSIHYIYRFKNEFSVNPDYIKTLHYCHGSIGYALYYTSVTIILGFSILAFSSFLPTIYFGLLTGLAMLIALVASLTLLPQLLIVFKPFGPPN